jgi:hypothetical protein
MGCVKMALGEMYGRTTVRPIVDTRAGDIAIVVVVARVAASPSGR